MRLAPLLALVLVSACASLTADHDQPIRISTSPAGAACTLTNGAGSWAVKQTPGTAMVDRHYSPLVVACTLEGYAPGSATLEPETRGRAYGNILLGGVPALVDANTGAGYTYAPDSVELPLAPQR